MNIFNFENRVKFYTNSLNENFNLHFNIKEQKVINNSNQKCYKEQGAHFNYTYIVNKEFKTSYMENKIIFPLLEGETVQKSYTKTHYVEPIIKLLKDLSNHNKSILLRPGDVFFNIPIPIITKTRPINNDNDKICDILGNKINKSYNILINLEKERHWGTGINSVKEYDIDFYKKNDKLLWRGGSTGFGWYDKWPTKRPNRRVLCEKYFEHPNKDIDIKCVGPVGSSPGDSTIIITDEHKLNMGDQLKSKFLISVEGGDVATNLKWILYSNSVVLMAKPTMESWLMESLLEPWVHYVPLNDDFGDVEEKYNWCLNNLDKCNEIAQNGKKYISHFFDEENENLITQAVIKKYMSFVDINT